MSRHKLDIDPEKIRELASEGCVQQDIARQLGFDRSLISKRFSQAYELGVSQCRISIRRQLYKLATGAKPHIVALLRLDDRLYGPLDKRPQVDQSEVLEALSDGNDSIPGGVSESKATGSA